MRIAAVQGGEIGGRVPREGRVRALGVIRVVFRDQEHEAEATASTFSDGPFDVVGLRPGRYWVFIDADQLQQLGLRSEPMSVMIGPADQGQLEEATSASSAPTGGCPSAPRPAHRGHPAPCVDSCS